jgi:hypothetical protein
MGGGRFDDGVGGPFESDRHGVPVAVYLYDAREETELIDVDERSKLDLEAPHRDLAKVLQ